MTAGPQDVVDVSINDVLMSGRCLRPAVNDVCPAVKDINDRRTTAGRFSSAFALFMLVAEALLRRFLVAALALRWPARYLIRAAARSAGDF